MATYQFNCDICKIYVEKETKGGNPPQNVKCPECDDEMYRVYTSPEVIFKGGDWPGEAVRAKNDQYRLSRQQAEKHEERDHDINIAQKEADEILQERRKGRRSVKEFAKHNPKKFQRYHQNKRKGFARDKDLKTYKAGPKE